MQRTLAQLSRQCENLELTPEPSKQIKKTGEWKILKKDYIKVLRDYYLLEKYPEGPPRHLQIMLSIESPQLCFRYNELKPEEQGIVWSSDNWGMEEKFDGCRMVAIFVRGEGLHFYSRNISVEDFLPIHYDNIWHEVDTDYLGTCFDSFFIDTEIMCENPNVCRMMEDRGIPTETVLQAVSSLLALNKEESISIQQAEAALSFRAFDVLMVNDQWEVMGYPLHRRRTGLRGLVDVLKRANMNVTLSKILVGQAAKEEFYAAILEEGGEGVVVKNLDSAYVATESRKRDGWVKIKRSMKNSLTSTGFGDTLDGWISGFQLGDEKKANKDLVGTIFVSIFLRNAKGEIREHEIARISGLTEGLRKEMTEVGSDGTPRMKESFYDRVVEVDGQCISARARRLKHAHLVRFRDDKYKDLCVLEEDFLNAMIL